MKYRALLAKYIDLVSTCEGTDFLDDAQSWAQAFGFTPEDLAALHRIRAENAGATPRKPLD